MISTRNVSLNYGNKVLFESVNINFFPGNCYGLIGANGAGKSTFLKILSGDIDDNNGEIEIERGKRISTLKQEQTAFDEYSVVETVIMGDTALSTVLKERDDIYAKEDFSDEDGLRAGELEEKIEELGGYEAESNARKFLSGLGVKETLHNSSMKTLPAGDKVKVLLAQSLFGDPDILLLDEPTNNLDLLAIKWLEEFLVNFEKTVIVVSHDRHFLNSVCTHMADIDYHKITIFVGNYDFWWDSSKLIRDLQKDQKRKAEEKAKDLKDFIARFSANASKSKQATSRKKALEKLNLNNIKASTRKFPYIDFKVDREPGNNILKVESLTKEVKGKKLLNNITFEIRPGDKVAILGDEIAITNLFQILMEEDEADSGSFEWGVTILRSHFPSNSKKVLENDVMSLLDWLRQFSKDKDETFIRGFLGRMLFSGEEATKKTNVLSGGESVRMVLSKMMLSGANMLLLDGPTAHLDLEAIQALNNGLIRFKGNVLFSSQDHQFLESIANRVFVIDDGKLTIHEMDFDQYMGLN